MKFEIIIQDYEIIVKECQDPTIKTFSVDEKSFFESYGEKTDPYDFDKNSEYMLIKHDKNSFKGIIYIQSNTLEEIEKELQFKLKEEFSDYDKDYNDTFCESLLNQIADGSSSSTYVIYDKNLNRVLFDNIPKKKPKKKRNNNSFIKNM